MPGPLIQTSGPWAVSKQQVDLMVYVPQAPSSGPNGNRQSPGPHQPRAAKKSGGEMKLGGAHISPGIKIGPPSS